MAFLFRVLPDDDAKSLCRGCIGTESAVDLDVLATVSVNFFLSLDAVHFKFNYIL